MRKLFTNLNQIKMKNQIKIVDGFVWFVITEKAKEVFSSGLFDVYVLHNDESESLCESYADVNDALESGLQLAIEVGWLPDAK
jgi:hypothetical protein